MKIDISMTRQIKHPLRNDAAIRYDEDDIRSNPLKLCAKVRIGLNLVRLHDRNIVSKRSQFSRRSLHLHATTRSAIRLRYDKRNLMAGTEHSLKRGNSELWGSAKNESHLEINANRSATDPSSA